MDFRAKYGQWAVVLGASEGLGAAWTLDLARRGLDVVLVARGVEKLEAAAAAARATGRQARAISLDLGRPDAMAALTEALGDLDVGLVIYNACYSVVGEYLSIGTEDKLRTIDVNVRGPAMMGEVFGQRFVERGRGGIVIVSSLSAFQGSAMVGVYAATKAFDIVLGEVLWEELRPRGVDVLVVVAGATLTPQFESVTPLAKRGQAMPMLPADVAREGLDALGRSGPTFIAGATNRWAHRVLSLLPRRWAVRFISRTTRAMYEGGP